MLASMLVVGCGNDGDDPQPGGLAAPAPPGDAPTMTFGEVDCGDELDLMTVAVTIVRNANALGDAHGGTTPDDLRVAVEEYTADDPDIDVQYADGRASVSRGLSCMLYIDLVDGAATVVPVP